MGRADSWDRDAIWESGNPFAEQDSATWKSGSSRSLASPARLSDNRRHPTPKRLSDPSATHPALSSNYDNYGGEPPRITSRLNPTGQQAHSAQSPRQRRAQPSATAASRTEVYDNRRTPTSNYMKQSCLPVDERDPILELAEQHKGRRLAKRAYKPGMIIRAPLHEASLPGITTDSNDRNRTHSIYGPVFTKVRHMMVVALYHNHYIALPLYTHNGNGLQHKYVPEEFVSVKDHRSQEPFTPLSKHPVLTTQTMNVDVHLMPPEVTVHLTYPVSRKYDLPSMPEGQLDPTSTKALIALYSATIPRPQSDPHPPSFL